MKNKQLFSKIITLVLISSITYIILCLNGAINMYCSCWANSTAFFGLSIYYFDKNSRTTNRISEWIISLSLIFGILLINLPIRIADWSETMISLPTCVMSILSIFLGWICYRHQRLYTYIIAFIIIAVCNSFLLEKYLSM